MNAAAQHTPGPWKICPPRNGLYHQAVSGELEDCGVDGAYQSYGQTWLYVEGPEPSQFVADLVVTNFEEGEANAWLIAAAPDMLTALREVEAHHVEQNRLRGRDEQRSKTLRIVRAAIAKATNEEQPA